MTTNDSVSTPINDGANGSVLANALAHPVADEVANQLANQMATQTAAQMHESLPEQLDILHTLQEGFADPHLEAGVDLMESLGAIPNKMAFKIGEAAEMVGVKQYVLRYWESEFEMLRPRKSKNNQRVYSRKDVETALMIKKLLYQDRFSIEGARTALKQLKSQVKEERGIKVMAQSQETAVMKLKGLLTEIRRVREIFC